MSSLAYYGHSYYSQLAYLYYFSCKQVTLIDHSTRPPQLVNLTSANKTTAMIPMHSTIASSINENNADDNMECVLQETSRISDLTMISSSSQSYNDNNFESKCNYEDGMYSRIQITN